MRKTRRTSVFLFEDQILGLSVLSEKTGVPQAEMIRRAIDTFLNLRSVENAESTKVDGSGVRKT